MKKIMIGIALGGIIFGSIVYAVNTYDATTILYNTSDGNTLNVQEAINDLYSMKNELDSIKSLGDATAVDIAKDKTAVVNGELITGISELSTAVNMHVVSATATSSAVTKSFTPTQDTTSIIIGGRRYGGVFNATIKDSTGTVIATQLISATADYSGYSSVEYVDVVVVNCNLKKGQTYTLNVPAQGSKYKLYAFVIYP